MQSKKGAIELSMTTIIVIVMGVTLLILGLVFVRGIFTKITGLTETAFADAEKEVQQRMGANEKVYVNDIHPEIDSGKTQIVFLGIQNFGDAAAVFTVEVVPGPEGGNKSWFTIPNPGTLQPGEKKGVPMEIRLPKGAVPGKSYTFTIQVKRGNEPYDSQSMIVSVKEE